MNPQSGSKLSLREFRAFKFSDPELDFSKTKPPPTSALRARNALGNRRFNSGIRPVLSSSCSPVNRREIRAERAKAE
jgi:hypothetical protein